MNLSTVVAYGLAAGLGGLTFLIAPAPTSAEPDVAGIPAASLVKPVPFLQATDRPGYESDGGDVAGGLQACHYENLRLGEPAMGFAHAQKSTDPNFPVFYAETADDFVLSDPNDPNGLNGCVLDQVQFAVTHEVGGISPQNWQGVKITIYQDRGNVCFGQPLDFPCQRNPDKGPAGYPLPSTDPALREHASCCGMPDKEAIVCELKVPMANVSWAPILNAPPDSYDITVSGLETFGCVLEKNKKYWIAPAPVMDFSGGPVTQGFIYLWTSQNPVDHEAQAISDVVGISQWSGLQSQIGWFQSDLYLAVWATKEAPPVEVCHYENLRLNDAGIPILHAQKSGGGPANLPFYSEVADDFILFDPNDPNGDNGCVLDQVQFAVMHDTPGISPQNWSGVKITIYQDRGNVCGGLQLDFPCQRNPAKGPGGYPVANPNASDRTHLPCCPNPAKAAIVCDLKVPMSNVTWTAIPGPAPDSYDITVSGLEPFNCVLEKNKKYWIAPTPVMEFIDPVNGTLQGATYLWSSPNAVDHEAQLISPDFTGIPQWSGINSQAGWFDTDIYLAVWANKAPPPVEPCHYENLRLGTGAVASQKASDFPFYAESADDFVLTDVDDPDGLNGCLLEQVGFGVFHSLPGVTPDAWSGVKITIYQDRGNVCGGQSMDPPCLRNPDKGPAGYPLPSPDDVIREHQSCCQSPSKEAIVCELKVPMSKVAWVPINHPLGQAYHVDVFGLGQYSCFLEKNKKYWIAPAPVMDFSVSGQTLLLTSPNLMDHETQQYFPAGGVDAWSQIQSQLGIVDPDLYLSVWATKAPPPVEPCHYDNLRKGSVFPPVATASQKVTDLVIYNESADDFVLTDPDDPDGDNICRLDQVQFAAWHDTPGISPLNWSGVKITIYQDRGNVCAGQIPAPPCERNPDKGPGGYPLPSDDPALRDHDACCLDPTKAAIVCELKIPMSKVTWTSQPDFPDTYDINVFGLDQYACDLEKNKKYWIAPAPVMDFFDATGLPQGFTYLLTSPNAVDHEAQTIRTDAANAGVWERLGTQFPWPETDLYLGIWATKAPSCPWDCVGNDGMIGIDEFLAVLGRWGPVVNNPCDFDGDGIIGIQEFLKILGTWGMCP